MVLGRIIWALNVGAWLLQNKNEAPVHQLPSLAPDAWIKNVDDDTHVHPIWSAERMDAE